MHDFDSWIAELEARHLAHLRFPEVSRALRALSSTYVERRETIAGGKALSGAGKRAAFALFYGPLHHVLVRHIVQSLPGACPDGAAGWSTLLDLGCGTGAAGAAWAAACPKPPHVVGIDRHPWALEEAAWTYRAFGLSARARLGDIAAPTLVGDVKSARGGRTGRSALLAAYALNELSDTARDAVLPRLLERAAAGDAVLVVEPLAGFVAPWWPRWRSAVEAAGGRSDEWRVRVELPAIVTKLDRAAGLKHHEITGRSLWLGGR